MRSLRRAARVAAVVLANVVLLVAFLGILEGVLRIGGWRPPGSFTNVRYDNDPMVGPWALPSQEAVAQSACFDVRSIHINRFGMRDRERDLTAHGPRIALVGDSFTQGLQVEDDATISRQLERRLGGRAEVLNFGVSSTGTAVQLLLYRQRVRPFRPGIVLVMFYAGNDVADNLPALKRGADPAMASLSPYLLLDPQGRLEDVPRPGRPRRTSRAVAALNGTSLGQWTYYVYTRARLPRPQAATATDGRTADALMAEAWDITEQVLARFHSEVSRDGARFGVVVIPADIRELDRTGAVDRETVDTVARLQRLAARQGFAFLDLSPAFQAFVREKRSGALGLPCDPHWSRWGHAEAAAAVHRFLDDQRWLP